MWRTLYVERALALFRDLEDDIVSSSPSEAESDEEVNDPLFVIVDDDDDDESDHEQPGPSTVTTPRRTTPRGRARKSLFRSRSAHAQPHQSSEPWKTENDPDIAPQTSRFMPHRPPGPQVNLHAAHSPMDLFKLYFSTATMRTLCKNTNAYAAKQQEMGMKFTWVDLEVEELYKFLGLLIYTALVVLPSVCDYWRQNFIMSVPFPATVMTRDRFRALMSNIHPSDPVEAISNDERKGTPQHDRMFRIQPLMDEIRTACQAHYHPRQELAVDERMVATKAKTGMTQYMKDKPTKWGMKLFVLAESSNGYTINFNLYTGKKQTHTVHGLSYDAVMDLIQPSYLGTGYHIYMDNFYTSPQLLLDLASMKFGACGTYRENRKGCPSGRGNALTKNSERGSVRWIREGPLVFVKWMDTREVSVCSTIHSAVGPGEVVQRRAKEGDGCWAKVKIPCPPSIIAYSKNMGGVDLSDQLIHYYSTHRRTAQWYRTLLLHLVDIATTNAYILHCEISSTKKEQHMSHKNFLSELVSQLCGVEQTGVPKNRRAEHVPVPIAEGTDASQKATKGRRTCQRCLLVDKKRSLTPWKCESCDVALCLILDRNCFKEWHR